MVTRLVLILSCLVSSSLVFGAIRVVRETPRDIIVEMESGEPSLSPTRREGRPMLELKVPGLDAEVEEGTPEIPSERVALVVPEGPVKITRIEESKYERTLDGEIAYAETGAVHSEFPRLARRDDRAYARVTGDAAATIDEIGHAGPDRVAFLKFNPIRYDAIRKRLTVRTRVRVHVAVEGGARHRSTDGIADAVALNGRSAPRRNFQTRELVIAHENHRSALARYLDRKRAMGRPIDEQYISGKTATQVREMIRQAYQSSTPPTSTLLVGNIDEIPAWRGSSDNTWTDFDYTLLDGDKIPDLSLGRLPVHSAAELEAFIDKSLARETEPRKVGEILLTAGRDTGMGCPANADKIGTKIQPAPTAALTKKYKTKVSTDEVFTGYNANPNLVFYDGHGNRTGMTEIPLLMSSLAKLKNTVFPLILDIACLNANWRGGAKQRNFAESILLLPHAGAAGILASGGSGNGHGFFQTIGATMVKGVEDKRLNEIGQVVLAAKITANTQDRTYWNYYGDPTSSVWESSW